MDIRRSLATFFQVIVITALLVGSSALAIGLFGFADVSTIAGVALVSAAVGAIAVVAHLLVSDWDVKPHL